MKTKLYLNHLRLTGNDANYYKNRLLMYQAHQQATSNVDYVEFGKQDIRGAISITEFDDRHCVSKPQIFFNTKEQLLGYVDGYILALEVNDLLKGEL